MTDIRKKKTKKNSKRKTTARAKGQTKAAQYINNLLELHKLQGILLTKLQKEL